MTRPLFDPRDLPDPPPMKPKDRPESRVKSTNQEKVEQKERRFAGRFSRCAEALSAIEKGKTYHVVSMGEWSAHDMILRCIEFMGPAELHFATWSISEDAIRQIILAQDRGDITAIHVIADYRLAIRSPEAQQILKAQATRFCVYTCHAKVYVLRNAAWGVVIVTSANMTSNPRIEVSVISEDPDLADWHIGWISEVIDRADPFDAKTKGATL